MVVVYGGIVVIYGYVEMWLYCYVVGDIVMWLCGCDVVGYVGRGAMLS